MYFAHRSSKVFILRLLHLFGLDCMHVQPLPSFLPATSCLLCMSFILADKMKKKKKKKKNFFFLSFPFFLNSFVFRWRSFLGSERIRHTLKIRPCFSGSLLCCRLTNVADGFELDLQLVCDCLNWCYAKMSSYSWNCISSFSLFFAPNLMCDSFVLCFCKVGFVWTWPPSECVVIYHLNLATVPNKGLLFLFCQLACGIIIGICFFHHLSRLILIEDSTERENEWTAADR